MNSLILCKPKNRRKIFGLNEKNAENYFTISRWIIKWLTRLTVSWNKHDNMCILLPKNLVTTYVLLWLAEKLRYVILRLAEKPVVNFFKPAVNQKKRLRAIRVNISCIWKFVTNIRDVKRFLLVTFLTFLRFEKFWTIFNRSLRRITRTQCIDAVYCYRCSVVCVYICWSQPWSVTKRLNQSRCRMWWTRVGPRNHV